MGQDYISFFDALAVLKNKLGESPSKEEFFMWCFLGKKLDGVDAYEKLSGEYSTISSGALGLPTRMSDETGYPTYHLDDVTRQLKSWYFLSSDIEIFEPKEHFITGHQLHERWTKLLKGEDEATEYIQDYSGSVLSISPESPRPALINWFPAGIGSIYSLDDIQLLEQHCHMIEQQTEAVGDIALGGLLSIKDVLAVEEHLAMKEPQAEVVNDTGAGSQTETIGDDRVRAGRYRERDLDAITWLAEMKKDKTDFDLDMLTNPQIETALKARNSTLWGKGFSGWNRNQRVWPKKRKGIKRQLKP